MPDTRPVTILESAIRLGRAGTTSPDAVLWAFAASEVVVLTPRTETPTPENIAPLVVHRDAASFLATFTHVDRVPAEFAADRTPVTLPAAVLLRGLSSEAGIVVNPGTADGFEIPAIAVAAFRAQLGGEEESDRVRFFVRQRFDGGALVPYALLRRTTQDGAVRDEVLRGVGQWGPDSHGSIDRALRLPLDSDLEEVSAAQAREFEEMAATGSFRPFRSR